MGNKTLGMELGKLPPQNIDFEEAVLGAIMLEKDRITDIAPIIQPESFYKEANQIIYRSIEKLYRDNKPIDIFTIVEDLRNSKKLEHVGGPAYVTSLTSKIASGSHSEFHARIIHQLFMKREMIRITSNIQTLAFDDGIDINSIIDSAQNSINQLTTGNIKQVGKKIGEVGRKALAKIESVIKKGIEQTGLKSYKKIMRLTGGWQPGHLIILAARPGQGKTKLAQEFAKMASESGDCGLFFSLEMQDEELYLRELSSMTGIETMYLKNGNLSEIDWQKIEHAQMKIEDQNILIDETPGLKISDFKAKARYHKKKDDIKYIIVDYLQLMRSPEHRGFREREIAEISSQLKQTAKELQVPVIALSQLSRDCEKRPDKRPMISDLRESGAIEQDADIIMFSFRPEHYGIMADENEESTKNLIELIFAKHRHGPTGTIKLWKTDNWTEISEKNSNETPY